MFYLNGCRYAEWPSDFNLQALVSLRLWDQATLPAGIELPAVTSLELGGQATLPAGIELPAVTSLELWGQATLPAGIELPAVTSLELGGQATLPAGVGLPKNLIIPIVPNIDQAILDAVKNGGGLDMGSWHRCETTHCRAGWAIHLAGQAGYELERKLDSPSGAGALIYAASRPGKPTPSFNCTNSEALADLEACAQETAAV